VTACERKDTVPTEFALLYERTGVENELVAWIVADKIGLAEAGTFPAQSSRLKRFNKQIFLYIKAALKENR